MLGDDRVGIWDASGGAFRPQPCVCVVRMTPQSSPACIMYSRFGMRVPCPLPLARSV